MYSVFIYDVFIYNVLIWRIYIAEFSENSNIKTMRMIIIIYRNDNYYQINFQKILYLLYIL